MISINGRTDIPRMGKFASLSFGLDFPSLGLTRRGFLRAGRAMGSNGDEALRWGGDLGPWQWWLFGQPVTVIADPEAAEAIASCDSLEVFRSEGLAPVLGKTSRYLRPAGHSPVLRSRPARKDSTECRRVCYQAVESEIDSRDPRFDLVEALRRAALKVALTYMGHSRSVLPPLETFLEACDSPATVVPALRTVPGFRGKWLEVTDSRIRLAHALNRDMCRQPWEAAVDEEVTMLFGWADNPAMVAARAFLRGGGDPSATTLRAGLSPSPVTFALRTAAIRCEPYPGLVLEKGDAIAIDLQSAAELGSKVDQFGGGTHRCAGDVLAKMFVEEALKFLLAEGIKPAGPGVEGLCRLSHGITSLPVTK